MFLSVRYSWGGLHLSPSEENKSKVSCFAAARSGDGPVVDFFPLQAKLFSLTMALFEMRRYWDDDEEEEDEKEIEAKVDKSKADKASRKKAKEAKADTEAEAEAEANQDMNSSTEGPTKKGKKKKKKRKKPAGEADGTVSEAPVADFTVLGERLDGKRARVRRVLPEWLANPDVVSTDLKEGRVSVGDLPGLDQETNQKLKSKVTQIIYICLMELRSISILFYLQGITHFFPVQRQVIPYLLSSPSHRLFRPPDVCVSAPTGSGKTLAFVVPVVQELKDRVVPRVRALVVLPGQDLAVQVHKVFRWFSEGTGLRVCLLSASRPFAQEQAELVRKGACGDCLSLADIVVATPGRLVDHLRRTEGFSLEHLIYLVIDEADRVMEDLQGDWLAAVEAAVYDGVGCRQRPPPPSGLNVAYLSRRGTPLQKLLFSATLSRNPEQLEQLHLFEPKLFTSAVRPSDIAAEIGKEEGRKETKGEEDRLDLVGHYTTPEELKEYVISGDSLKKPHLLLHLLRTRFRAKKALVFTKSLEHTHTLSVLLKKCGLSVGEMSSQVAKGSRGKVLGQLSSGRLEAVVCTDALARGVDVGGGVDLVVSYDAPSSALSHVHRVGRTARAGREGSAVTLCEGPAEERRFRAMLKEVGKGRNVETMEVEDDDLEEVEEVIQRASREAKEEMRAEKERKRPKAKKKKASGEKNKFKTKKGPKDISKVS